MIRLTVRTAEEHVGILRDYRQSFEIFAQSFLNSQPTLKKEKLVVEVLPRNHSYGNCVTEFSLDVGYTQLALQKLCNKFAQRVVGMRTSSLVSNEVKAVLKNGLRVVVVDSAMKSKNLEIV